MNYDEILDTHHVVRLIPKRNELIDRGTKRISANPNAFMLSDREMLLSDPGISIGWVEFDDGAGEFNTNLSRAFIATAERFYKRKSFQEIQSINPLIAFGNVGRIRKYSKGTLGVDVKFGREWNSNDDHSRLCFAPEFNREFGRIAQASEIVIYKRFVEVVF